MKCETRCEHTEERFFYCQTWCFISACILFINNLLKIKCTKAQRTKHHTRIMKSMIRLKKKKRFKHIFSSLSQNIVLFGIKNERKTNWFDGLIEVDVWWLCWCALLNKPETTFFEVFLYDYYRSEFKNAQFSWTMTTPGHILFPFSAMRIYIYPSDVLYNTQKEHELK